MKEPKLKTVYVCSNCGETSPRWMGRCPSCGSWNTMNEDVVAEAPKAGLSSIAFCCISTGVFGFPQEEAASIAVATVRRWLNEHPDVPMTVVFNVFSETDESLYRPLLGL